MPRIAEGSTALLEVDSMTPEEPIQHTPAVAVVIPVYNGEAYLAECIESVLAQTHLPAEIVVVDDGSKDRSLAIAERYPQVQALSQRNAGVSASRNRGVAASSSPWIAFLDADDVWVPNKLERQLAAAQAGHADVCFSSKRMLYPSEAHDVFLHGLEVQPPASGRVAAQLRLGHSFTPSSALVRREAFLRTEGFDVNASPCEDWDLWLQLAAQKARFVSCPESLVLYRVHATNASNQGERMYEASMRTYDHRVAPFVRPPWRMVSRFRAKSRFLAALALVNREQGRPHAAIMLSSLAHNPFGEWHRYAVLAHTLLKTLHLLR